jgi:hypothetical protein
MISSIPKHVSRNEIIFRHSSQKSLILLNRLLFNTALPLLLLPLAVRRIHTKQRPCSSRCLIVRFARFLESSQYYKFSKFRVSCRESNGKKISILSKAPGLRSSIPVFDRRTPTQLLLRLFSPRLYRVPRKHRVHARPSFEKRTRERPDGLYSLLARSQPSRHLISTPPDHLDQRPPLQTLHLTNQLHAEVATLLCAAASLDCLGLAPVLCIIGGFARRPTRIVRASAR